MSGVYEHCVHFDGRTLFRPGRAAATGVEYRSVEIDPVIRRDGHLPIRFPCHADARDVPEADRCPSRRWPTPEEVGAARSETARAMEAVIEGRCPVCGGRMQRRTSAGGGYTARCPAGCGTSVIACGRRR